MDPRLSLLVLLLPGLLPALWREPPAAGPARLPAGLGADQVRARLGAPSRISRQIHAHRGLEQWHYGPPLNLRLDFECPRGQAPHLVRQRPARLP